ncbi:MAG: chlorophyllase [Oscillospiraceae bacterium]|nr:chlorophyllase [Oscillospiraceae bacterium]
MNTLTDFPLLKHFRGTEPALCRIGVLVGALVIGSGCSALYWPGPVGCLLLCAVVMLLLELAFWLAQKFLRAALGHGLGWLMALGLLYGSVVYTVQNGAGEGWTWRVWLFSAAVTAPLWLLAASGWSIVRYRRMNAVTLAAALLSVTAVILLAVLLFTEGFSDNYIPRYLALNPCSHEKNSALPAGPGPCTANMLDYGPETDLESGTVNLSWYMSRDTGNITGNYVDAYWDYDLTAVPLAGRVWYPEDGKNCPVLFMAHGNHEITTESYLGYDYLGQYLASYGYVVVSVDQNACNMLTGENAGRAVLLLEHIGLLLDYSRERENPLYGRLDEEKIAIAGHSRGGEMVATAYLFNSYDRYPENGTVEFDYNYSIQSIIAIAPTVNQYKPADHSVKIQDVNYLLLHGAADRDVSTFMGMSQYENITFSGQGDFLKTALYIAGANHGQFNSLWGAFDQRGPFSALLNVESLLPEDQQQEIACLFIKAFLDVTLLEDRSCRTLLTDWKQYAAQLPDTVYVQCWESSAFQPVAGFEEDSDLETGTMEGTILSAQGVRLWTEELMDFGGEDTHALHLQWNGRASFDVSLPELDLTGRAVSFDICDLNSSAVKSGKYSLLDGDVVLTDADGHAASARISDFAAVFPILPVRTDKLDFVFDTCVYKKAFATVAIPAEAFVPEGEAFDAGRTVGLSFRFNGSGQAAIDNIGLEAAA